MKTQIVLKTITLKDKRITYQLRQSWRSRYIRITIHPQKGLVVSGPKLISQSKIEDFLKQKQDWILSKLKIRHFKEQKKFKFSPQSQITLLGKDYRLEIEKSSTIRPQIELKTTRLVISLPGDNLQTAEKFFHKWLDRFTKQTIVGRVEEYAKKFHLKYNRISIKNQQTVWGSCSTKKNLNFSRRLIQAPLWLTDYVICHELAHLTHQNHSQKFWQLVGEYYPQYKKAKRHLKAYQPKVKLA